MAFLRRVVGAALSVLVVSGCASAAAGSTKPPARGTLRGSLSAVGGPAPGAPRPAAGTVSILRGSTVVATVQVADGAFARLLEAGRFTVTGRLDGGTACRSAVVDVSAGATTTVRVVCDIK